MNMQANHQMNLKVNRNFPSSRWLAVLSVALFVIPGSAEWVRAQSVRAGVSSREAYVGQPIFMQVEVADASDHEPPQIPQVDGLDISLAGVPSRSSRLSIINGRRSESVSMTYRYLIVPRREGEFEIPGFVVNLGNRRETTRPFSIIVSESETGDLLFVEVTGNEDEAYVGESVRLKLKIWLRPFTDRERGIRLDEGNMWSLIGRSTKWGVFGDEIQRMANNNQRPAGKEVLRDNGQGEQKAYYLYEVDADIYPQKPGPVDIGNVQIVASYPEQLGVRRSRFPSLFDDDDFGMGLSRDLMEEFFRDSPFNRETLTLERTRPIAAGAELPPLVIRDVPTDGRPSDYRGAVGQYQIVTRANPVSVKAGDPIKLQILIQGDGPMELVPPPPLSQINSLTADFQVREDTLAGYVEGDAKLFETTIRPRREGVAQIPPVPFTFFDPEAETFQTVRSEPISIEVGKAEVLSLDEIAGDNAGSSRPTGSQSDRAIESKPQFELASPEQILAESALDRPNSLWGSPADWLWWSPPILFLLALAMSRLRRTSAVNGTGRHRLASDIRRAATPSQLVAALDRAWQGVPPRELRDVWEAAQQSAYSPLPGRPLDQLKSEALTALRRLDSPQKARTIGRSLVKAGLVLMFASSASLISADESNVASGPELTHEQQRALIEEANHLSWLAFEETDRAIQQEQLGKAADKYELVLRAGNESAGLRANLGQVFLAMEEPARALAQFEIAARLDPGDFAMRQRILEIRSKIDGASPVSNSTSFDWTALRNRAADWNRFFPPLWIKGAALVAWWTLWGLALLRWPFRWTVRPWAWTVTSLVLAITALSLALTAWSERQQDAVVTAASVDVREGDGDSFPVIQSLPGGSFLNIVDQRNEWVRIDTDRGPGWLPRSDIVFLCRDNQSAM